MVFCFVSCGNVEGIKKRQFSIVKEYFLFNNNYLLEHSGGFYSQNLFKFTKIYSGLSRTDYYLRGFFYFFFIFPRVFGNFNRFRQKKLQTEYFQNLIFLLRFAKSRSDNRFFGLKVAPNSRFLAPM